MPRPCASYSTVQGANELHTHMCTCTSAHTLRDQLRGKCKHFIFQVAPASAHRHWHSCSSLHLLMLGLSPAPVGTRYVSHHSSAFDALCWHKIDTLQTHSPPTVCGLPQSLFSLLMLRPTFIPNAGTKVIKTTITTIYLKLQTPNSGTFLSSSGIGTLEFIDGERVRLCGKRVKKRFNKKNG